MLRARALMCLASASAIKTLRGVVRYEEVIKAAQGGHRGTPYELLAVIITEYAKAGKKVHLRHLSEDCRALIDKAESIIEVNHFEDPTYKVVRDVR